MTRHRTLSPWARIALREGWTFGSAATEDVFGRGPGRHQRLVGFALLLSLLAALAAREYPTLALVFAALALAADVWVLKTGGRALRACTVAIERSRRRSARRHPHTPDWTWAVMRAQARSLMFGANMIIDYHWFAAISLATLLIFAHRNAHVESALEDATPLLLMVGAALLSLAVLALFVRSERDRRRIGRAVLQARCIRCDYQIMRPADLRHPIHCPLCPECGERYPLHPPPAADPRAAW